MEERRSGSQSNEGKVNQTPEQLAAAAGYLESRKALSEAVRKHASGRLFFTRRAMMHQLTELFSLREQHLPLASFREKLGAKKAEEIEGLFAETAVQLNEIKEKTLATAPELTARHWAKIALQASLQLKSYLSELLAITGYTKEELKDIGKKLSISGVLNIPAGIAANVSAGAAIAHEVTNPIVHLGPITDWKTLGYVGGSYLAHYGSMYLSYRTNRRLLESPEVNTSPNILATSAYFITKKLFSESKLATKVGIGIGIGIGVGAGVAGLPLIQETGFLPSLIFSVVAPQIVLARNAAGAAYQLTEAGLNTAWMKTAEWKKRRSK